MPNEHLPLLAMMVQERDATIGTLVKSIEMQLCPVVFGEESTRNSDILAHGAVEGAILQIAEQKNYGPSLSDLQGCCGPELGEIPLNLAIQRWEIHDVSMLPVDVRDVVKRRRELRQSAHVECTQWFQALDPDTQMQVLAGTLKKLKVKVQNQQQSEKATPLPRGQRSLQTFFGSEKAIDRERAASVEPLAPRSYYETIFLPFHLRANTDMYRHQPPVSFDSTALDKVLSCKAPAESHAQTRDSLLRKLQNAPRATPLRHTSAVPVCKGVEIDEAEIQLQRLRQMPMKLLYFHGSRRPNYWGTWSRSLCTVDGRRPFARDANQLDYDVDSDAEWEDEDEGEELRSDDDDEGEGDEDDDDEDDEDFDEVNGFVVGDRIPHPHSDLLLGEGSTDCGSNDGSSESEFISEDEEIEEINPEEEVCMDQMDVDEDCGLETPSMRRKSSRRAAKPSIESLVSEEYFKRESHQPKQRRHKIVPITPVVVGLVWGDISYCADSSTRATLSRLDVSGIYTNTPLNVSMDPQDVLRSKSDGPSSAPVRKGKVITNEDLFALASVVHGSSLGIAKLVDEVKTHITEATKAQIERLIHENAVKEKRPPATRQIWFVNSSLVDRAREARKTGAFGNDVTLSPSIQDDAGLFFGNACKRQRTEDDA
ncbi:hypothetical protein LPJ81_000785 [Coemansia sp. IMI 209127]|nr:hypothetical protein LPJ81_000785 [Coemansia sp. IMI 209127]